MIRLTREVRFSIGDKHRHDSPITNSWGGWPTIAGVAPWMVFQCTLKGEIDPVSGYLCNIKLIDDALRKNVITSANKFRGQSCEALLKFAANEINGAFPKNCELESLRLQASPTLEYTLFTHDPEMIELTQQFEFSASHRLHNPKLSDEQNREMYGKCNNPHGHGHNYVVMVTVAGSPGEHGTVVALEEFESLVKEKVIDRMDHRNLNIELEEFQDTNPSVENIAIVIWELLEGTIALLPGNNASLSRVKVYETPKTWAEYCGPTS